MFRKHCSDEQLLALRDGELEAGKAEEVALHLAACWLCRGRQQELEVAAQHLARLVDTAGYPDPGWLPVAHRRLDEAMERHEATMPSEEPRMRWWRWVLVPLACAAAVASVLVVTRAPKPVEVRKAPAPAARHLVAKAVEPAAPPVRSLPAVTPPELVRSEMPSRLVIPEPPRDLVAAAIQADYVLHRAGACIRESVETSLTADGWVAVRGVVESSERRAELEAGLAQVPYVRFEVAAADTISIPRTAAPAVDAATVRPAELRLQKLLEEHFRGAANPARAIADFSNRGASLSAALRSEAWALSQITGKYPSARTAGLRPPTRWLLENMIREHSAGIRQRTAELRAHLEAVLGAQPASRPARELEWPEAVEPLEAAANEVDALTRGLFAGGALAGDPMDAARRLLSRASELEAAALELERAAHGVLERRDARAANQSTRP